MKTQILGLIFALFLTINLASAVVITSVVSDSFSPGKEGSIRIGVENTLIDDIQDVVLTLDFKGLPFIPVRGSSDGFDELNSGDDGLFNFVIRASNDITPGNYQIPYTITFDENDVPKIRTGTIGIKVEGTTELSYSIDTENPIIGQEGKISLKIINKGFADAKFVSVRAVPSGFTLLSEDDIYIGTVSSDDFETATFNVIFNSNNPSLSAIIEYRDFDNNKFTKSIDLPVKVYTQDRAIELGLIKKNNTPLYIGIGIVVIIAWFVWRSIAKRRRIKKSMQRS
ncbi:hypothetical protein AUJ84_03780 [Candidatus Pacearchaeota archaeon CG1_02_32_132]|nr:MAG: hypothetical protein AUJ84_03780 [Candidatus Pacearchaeota archaeon CG1_02_32_132]